MGKRLVLDLLTTFFFALLVVYESSLFFGLVGGEGVDSKVKKYRRTLLIIKIDIIMFPGVLPLNQVISKAFVWLPYVLVPLCLERHCPSWYLGGRFKFFFEIPPRFPRFFEMNLNPYLR